ncbi:MAG: choice-of-anchor D domain-containing protein [Candidatus Acidiferrum sp.]
MSVGHAQVLLHQTSTRIRRECSLPTLLVVVLLVPQFLVLSGCAGLVNGKQPGVQAGFRLSPAIVNFGQVAVGKQSTQLVSMSNTGNAALNITQVKVSNTQFSILGMPTPMALAVGQTGTFLVAVNPTSTGTLTGTLTAQGDGGSTPVIVNLSATAVSAQPQLSLNPANINFGSVSTGLRATNNLVLTNSGATNLTISLLTLTGADFAISGISTPATIPAGQSISAVATFSPTAAGSTTGSLVITSNDPANPTLVVPLSGSGTIVATGQLSANPGLLSFGNVATGSSTEKQIVVTNAGNAAVRISSATAVGAGLTISGVAAPATLSPSERVVLTASFSPNAAGSDTGSITIVSDAGNSPLTIPVSGTGVQAGLTISPASYNFGSVVDGQTKSQTFTVTNTGTAALTIAGLSANGNAYSVSGLVTPATIAAGSSATFAVLFEPTIAGSLTGTVSIVSNAPNSPNVLSLSGTGTAATVTLSSNPSSMTFTNVNAGSSSSKSVTITNSGNTSVSISQVTVNAKDFKVSGITTPFTLTAGQTAAMSVSFSPSTSESVTGNIEVASSQGATAVISVSGNGVQPSLTITPSSASFGDVTVGSPVTQTIQLSNSGTGTLSVTQVSVAGSGFSTGTLSLPIALSSGQSTSFNVQFAPASAGTASGSVTIVSNALNSPAVIAMSGTGVASTQILTFSTTSLGFGNVNTGSSSTQSVTVTNGGNASVTVSQISESGAGFTLSGAGTPVTLTAGQSLTFGVIFDPSAAGSATGSVTVSSTASGSPKTIALSGTGVQETAHSATLTWTASTSTVSGYNVYRSTTSGSGYAKINASLVVSVTYDDTTVQSGTTYYYVVTAVNAGGEESTDSNQATAVIP